MKKAIDRDFYKGKRFFVTGHTGFKGSWMCKALQMLGAQVCGYALEPPTEPSLFRMLEPGANMESIIGDIRDSTSLKQAMLRFSPDLVIHMAAQPIVREGYRNPAYTYETNVMGTVHLLEAVRECPSVRSFLNVTTDKVYLNREWEWGYREEDTLDGYDPYSNSKSCSELVTAAYRRSFFSGEGCPAISTARAGNVIGGGDFAVDRIIPDCIRAAQMGKDIPVRNPYSTRPYQHVLEPVMAYLMIAERQYRDKSLAGCYNVGPDETDCLTTGELVSLFCEKWNEAGGKKVDWRNEHDGGPHEAGFLKLDCSKIKKTFAWSPKWHVDKTMEMIVEWTNVYLAQADVSKCMREQIRAFCE